MPTVLKNYVICFQLKLAVEQQAINGHSTVNAERCRRKV
jgi:hypothetical protein